MRRRKRPTESDRLETLAYSAHRRGDPAEAARQHKAAAREARREHALKEEARKNPKLVPSYFKRRFYQLMLEADAENGTDIAKDYSHFANATCLPSSRSPEENEALRQELIRKLDAILADLEREAEEAEAADEAGEWTDQENAAGS